MELSRIATELSPLMFALGISFVSNANTGTPSSVVLPAFPPTAPTFIPADAAALARVPMFPWVVTDVMVTTLLKGPQS